MFLKNLLLGAYYHSTLGWRLRWIERTADQGRAPVMVLIYHRIADDAANLWTMSNEMFVRQITWARQHYEIVSLTEAQRRVRSGHNERPCVSITFDDGYAVNCQHALPFLVRERIPCTYFVTTEGALTGSPFGHDLAMGNRFEPNTLEQLKALVAAGIEIGAHTRTHPAVAQITDAAELHDEIVTARDELQEAVGQPIRYFAFPFGQHHRLSASAIHLAYHCGYEAVCSAYGGYNFPGDDAFHLQRIPADENFLRFRNWLTLDPRKRHSVRRFKYGELQAPKPREVVVT